MITALVLLSRRQMRLLYRSPAIAAWYAVLPLLLIATMMPVMKVVVPKDAAAQVVPGFTLLFSAFLATTLAGRVVRDRQSGVWRWFIATPASPLAIAGAPALTVVSLGVSQVAVALVFGHLFYGLNIGADRVGLFAFLAVPIGAGLLLASLTDDLALQANILNPLAIVSSVLGGAVIPLSVQPDWAQVAARFSPHYYALHDGLLGAGVVAGLGVILSGTGILRLNRIEHYL